jgi:multiple sugar transport system permease protein
MKRRKAFPVFMQILIVLMIILYMLPIFYLGVTSIKPWATIFKVPPTFNFKPTIASYVRLFYKTVDYLPSEKPTEKQAAQMDWKDRLMWDQTGQKTAGLSDASRRFINSFIISIASTFFSVILGLFAAYALSRFKMKGKGDVMFFILSTRMLPAVVVTIPLYLMFKTFQLYDTHVGLILLYVAFNISFAVWVLKGFIDDIPTEYEKAALVDGYSRIQAFWKVVVPQAATGIAATTVFCYIFSWNEYAFALMMTTRAAQTAPVFIQQIKSSIGLDWGAISAGSFLFLIPVVVFTFLMRRYLLAGITFGAIRK